MARRSKTSCVRAESGRKRRGRGVLGAAFCVLREDPSPVEATPSPEGGEGGWAAPLEEQRCAGVVFMEKTRCLYRGAGAHFCAHTARLLPVTNFAQVFVGTGIKIFLKGADFGVRSGKSNTVERAPCASPTPNGPTGSLWSMQPARKDTGDGMVPPHGVDPASCHSQEAAARPARDGRRCATQPSNA